MTLIIFYPEIPILSTILSGEILQVTIAPAAASTFIGEKGYKKEALQSANAKIPGVTAKTATVSASYKKYHRKSPVSTIWLLQ